MMQVSAGKHTFYNDLRLGGRVAYKVHERIYVGLNYEIDRSKYVVSRTGSFSPSEDVIGITGGVPSAIDPTLVDVNQVDLSRTFKGKDFDYFHDVHLIGMVRLPVRKQFVTYATVGLGYSVDNVRGVSSFLYQAQFDSVPGLTGSNTLIAYDKSVAWNLTGYVSLMMSYKLTDHTEIGLEQSSLLVPYFGTFYSCLTMKTFF